MIFILSVGPSALIYFSKKFEISADVIFVGAAPTWPNLTQPDQTIMRYLMTSYMKVQHQSPHLQGRAGKNSWRLSEVTIGNLKTVSQNSKLFPALTTPAKSGVTQPAGTLAVETWSSHKGDYFLTALRNWLKIVYHGLISSTLLEWTKKTPFLFSIPELLTGTQTILGAMRHAAEEGQSQVTS